MASWSCAHCSTENRDDARFCRICGAARPAPVARSGRLGGTGPIAPGVTLQSRYKLAREVARGGQGAVFEAVDMHTGRRVALKAVRLEAVAGPQDYTDAAARIQHEAQMLGRLSHPHIVQVVDQFEENGYPYVVMEYVEGQTLARAIASAGGRLPETQAVYVACQLCEALSYLHGQAPPIIFRDVKPENVMVDTFQNVKLIDFGIARRYRPGARSDTQVYGSPGYAAPEQYGSGQTDARSDVFALGVTLHHMVTGYNPATNADPLGNLPSARAMNPAVSGELDAIIQRATRLVPEQRWQTAAEMQQALSACPAARPQSALPGAVASPPATTRACRRCQQMISASAVFCRFCGERQC
jgi:serine/threonine protein kinase, bacterial